MTLISIVFGFQLITGLAGFIALANSFRFLPANRNIDHPLRSWRIFYRVMAVLMCNLWSFLLTMSLLGALPLEGLVHNVRDSSEPIQATVMLLAPLPLLPVLYILYAKLVRWSARREAAR